MDKYEKVAYSLLGIVAVLYIAVLIVGMMTALPFGLIGLALFIGIGALMVKALKERLENKEDDYYSKKVHK